MDRDIDGLSGATLSTRAVSGILINYSDALHLNARHVLETWLLDWYGIAPPKITDAYPVGSHWITQVGERLYFDTRKIDNMPRRCTAPFRWQIKWLSSAAICSCY